MSKNTHSFKLHKLAFFTLTYFGVVGGGVAYSASVSTGVNNTITGENSTTMGENLINTSRQSSLYGENSTLTGDNIGKEELNHLINTQADKIQARNNKQQELDRTATNISTNQLNQDTIRRRIELLKEANREATRKVDQLQELNNQKSTKEHELETLRQALESAKAEATNQSTHTDRTVWSNFENQLRSLNWDKLTETNGVDQLANELKTKVENDFPTITKYDVEKYKPLINGYVNSKGIFGKNRDIVEYEISGFFPRERGYEDKINNLMNTLINETNHQNKLIHTVNDIQPTKYLKSPITNQESIQRYLTYNQFLKNDDVKEFIGEYTESNDYGYGYEKVYSFPNTASEHYSHNMDNGIYGNQGLLRDSYHPLIQDVTLNVESLISTPMLKNKKEIYSFINHVNTVLRFSLSDFKNKEVISSADIAQLDNAFNAFKNLKNEINWDAEQSSWTIDKNEYKSKIDNLEPFFAKIKDYIDSYNANLNDPSNNQKKADMLKKYNTLLNEDNNLIANQKLREANLSQKGQELLEKFNRIASESNDKAVAEMNDMIDKLKLFDRNHQIVREVNEKVTELTNKIQSKEREIAEKQAELNTINTSISNNALTEEERNANTLREEKQREKEQLEQEKATKERELEELNRAIQSGNLTNKGLQNIGIGYNNFNSGAKAITIGNENTVLADGAVAIRNNNNLSKEATNTFVLGSNVTTNIPNSVALGKDTTLSAPIATPSHRIAGTQYNFAGIAPVGTVSIGAEGKERTLTNLAAGRISNTSTDGINGSQLNAVIETLNGLSTELTTLKNAPKTKAPVIKAGDGLSLTEGDDGSITLSNALTFNSGDGINVNKEGNNITITNTQPLSAEDKTKYDTASTNASSALEKANANEGNITTLTDKVTTVTNTANEALGKANTAVQPDKLKAGNGISVSKGENGDITITNTHPLSDENKTKYDNASAKAETALQPESLVAGNGVTVNNAGGKVTITNTGVIEIQAGDGVGVQNNHGVVTVSNTKPDLSFEGKDGITVDKQGNNVVISATGLAPKGTGVNNVEGANGISVAKEGDKFIITNTKPFEDTDKDTLNTASGKANTAVQPDKLKAGNGISIDKAENGDITVTNTKPFEDADKERLNNASTNANSALEKANTNEGAINTANGKITANEGNITTLTGNVTAVTNTANEALGKANTNAETINNVSGVANEALSKANTAVQPDKLKAGNGISVSKSDNGDITIENTKAFENADKEKLNTAFDKSNTAVQPNDLTAGKGITINKGQNGINISTDITGGRGISVVESNNGLTINNLMEIKAGKGVKIDNDGNTYTISSTGSVLPRFEIRGDDKVIHEVVGALNVAGDENIETTTEGGKVTVKLKKDIDVNSVKSGDNTFGKGGLKVGNTLITAKGAYMGNQVVDGVADGEIAPNSKQAINGGQLAPVVERILDHERTITQLDGKIGYLDQRITRMDKKHNAGIAGVAAMVGIPQVMEAGGVVFGAGVGNHAGANAVAVGASMASDNGRHMIKTSFSVNSQKQVTSSIGYGFKWK